jgi:hypothetical protein
MIDFSDIFIWITSNWQYWIMIVPFALVVIVVRALR